jgi:hypothetical protein
LTVAITGGSNLNSGDFSAARVQQRKLCDQKDYWNSLGSTIPHWKTRLQPVNLFWINGHNNNYIPVYKTKYNNSETKLYFSTKHAQHS